MVTNLNALAGNIEVKANMTAKVADDFAQPTHSPTLTSTKSYAFGTGSGQINQYWVDQRVLAATSEELDLAGSLTNALGGLVTFAHVKLLIIRNVTATSGYDLLVGGAASNAWAAPFGDASDILTVGPNSMLVLENYVDGFAVTAGTGDLLKIDAGANSVTYEIQLFGVE